MAEAQPLLRPDAEGQDDLETTFPVPASFKKPRGSAVTTFEFFVAALLPWLMFTVVVTLFIINYYELSSVVWIVVAACVLMGVFLIGMGVGQTRSVHFAVGLLCLAATCVGTSVGIYIYDIYARDYWGMKNGAEYKNVSPSSKGSDHADAAVYSFTPDAFVDTERTLGYMEAGTVYCVAPVASQRYSDAPQYWAAGKDCCGQRSTFRCGDAADTQAKSGVRITDEEDRARYNTAIRMAEAVYSLTPDETGRFSLIWTSNDHLKADLWESCIHLLILSSSMYFICSVGAAIILRKSLMSAQ
jgi:hypothetical protein